MNILRTYFNSYTEAAPLAVFRILFGLMMLWSIIRFWSYGWIDKLYIQPQFHFSYYGFEWVTPIGLYTYVLFFICGLSAILITLGYRYRLAIGVFFLTFTYIELMDKTTYLNHYYFVSALSFLLFFLPANAYFSLDAKRNATKAFKYIPKWNIDALKLLLGIVYFYAGLAKLNSDWLLKAMPLKIWLPSKFDIPFIGNFMGAEWVHYAFSWTGTIYDLSIPFLLVWSRTRGVAFVAVVIFHILTRILFPIGMFPYIMIVSTLIFFDSNFHQKILGFISRVLKIDSSIFNTKKKKPVVSTIQTSIFQVVIVVFFVIQLLFPWRYTLYPGELFWTEQGYRFSWRVMLMEKTGYAQFKIVDPKTKKWFYVDNTNFLTPFQEKQMSFQPDFILEYAHFLNTYYQDKGITNPEVYVECYVALNGRRSRLYIDPEIDLSKEKDSFKTKNWILPFHDKIKGI